MEASRWGGGAWEKMEEAKIWTLDGEMERKEEEGKMKAQQEK